MILDTKIDSESLLELDSERIYKYIDICYKNIFYKIGRFINKKFRIKF
jgi:hypothetical protein